jgi:hypothetical protein
MSLAVEFDEGVIEYGTIYDRRRAHDVANNALECLRGSTGRGKTRRHPGLNPFRVRFGYAGYQDERPIP